MSTLRSSQNPVKTSAIAGAAWRLTAPAAAMVAAALLLGAQRAGAQLLVKEHPAKAMGLEAVERRGEQIPPGLRFTDSRGRPVRIGDYFDGKRPVVLVFGYYDCPMLCTLVFNGVQKALNELEWTLGEEYLALAVSFDHTNTTPMAAGRQAAYLAGYRKELPESAWPFLTADAENARALAEAVGYKYLYIPESGEFSHEALIVVVSPDGVVSNYLYGVEYPAKQLRLALMDAADGNVGSVFDRFYFFCHRYDPSSGEYTLQAMRIMQIGGGLTALALGSTIAGLFIGGARRARRRASRAAPAPVSAHAVMQVDTSVS